jgi:hypothetical protein
VVRPADESDVLGRGAYGVPFVSVVGRDRVFGAQFHPEKSSVDGLRLLASFSAICAPAEAARSAAVEGRPEAGRPHQIAGLDAPRR